jgi:hypothetical protein
VGSQFRGHTTQTKQKILIRVPARTRSDRQAKRPTGERLTGVVRLNGITVQMSCPEYLRLRQHYDAALQRWAQIELSSYRPGLIDASARLAELVRQKALDERNAATQRLRFHEQNCPTCNPRRKPTGQFN